MTKVPCIGPCNSKARRAWSDYERAFAAWQTTYDAYAEAMEAGTAEGDPPEPPAEPNIPVVAGAPVLCRRCTTAVLSALSELDHLAGQLQANIDGHRGQAGSDQEQTGKRGKASTTPSVDPRVDELDALYRDLTAAEDWWRGVRGYSARPYMGEKGEQPLHAGSHPRSMTLSWLGERIDQILLHPDCGKFGLQLLVWQRRLRELTHSAPIPRRRAAHCPECGRATLFRCDHGDTECHNPDCRKVLHEEEYEAALAKELQHAKVQARLHGRRSDPEWEYATTSGPRRDFDSRVPPAGNGWERNTDVGRGGWKRVVDGEEAYWRRRRKDANEWRIDPDTFLLTGPAVGQSFSGEELDAQDWPPCPACGTTVVVDRVDIRALGDALPVYISGHWQCPNECDPRKTVSQEAS